MTHHHSPEHLLGTNLTYQYHTHPSRLRKSRAPTPAGKRPSRSRSVRSSRERRRGRLSGELGALVTGVEHVSITNTNTRFKYLHFTAWLLVQVL